ncbi:MAG: histidine--tRNA ligase [Firmicutes bacterium]|nr:histidine--tRNA ligase [Bacillota bacterium]
MRNRRPFRAIKGVRDILPPESEQWNRVEQVAREVFATYGFGEIRLPIFESTELFARSVGSETDIVSKEMYTFADAGADEESRETQISLRPEATASVCRAYIEHGMHTWPGDVKLYYIGPMFRRERPQKGRYRQFYQIGAEVLGQSDTPGLDAEVIEMLLVFFRRVGLDTPLGEVRTKAAEDRRNDSSSASAAPPHLRPVTLFINSIGCPACRPSYVEQLRNALETVRDQLGPDSQRRIQTNPLRVLDSKLDSEQAVIETLPRITDHLCAACREHYVRLQEQLELRGIPFVENWRLVRGLDYYTRTTFEVTAPGLGAQNAVCGGGRYDGLIELLGGPRNVKGIGFAIGTDRLLLSLQDRAQPKGPSGKAAQARLDAFLVWMGSAEYPAAVRLARLLRAAGRRVELPHDALKLRRALELADKLGARFAVLIGEEEIASGKFTVKHLSTGEQTQCVEADLIRHIQAAAQN